MATGSRPFARARGPGAQGVAVGRLREPWRRGRSGKERARPGRRRKREGRRIGCARRHERRSGGRFVDERQRGRRFQRRRRNGFDARRRKLQRLASWGRGALREPRGRHRPRPLRHHRLHGGTALLPQRGRPIDERLGAHVEAGEPKRQAADSLVCVRLEANDAAFAPEEHLTGGQNDLEAKHHALGPRLRPDESDARSREGVELLLEILIFARVRSRNADRDGRRARIGVHDHQG